MKRLENSLDTKLGSSDKKFEGLENSLEKKFESLENNFESLENSLEKKKRKTHMASVLISNFGV